LSRCWYAPPKELDEYEPFVGHVIACCESNTAGLQIEGGTDTNHEYYDLASAHVGKGLNWSIGEVEANLNNFGPVVTFLSSENQRGDHNLGLHFRKFQSLIAERGGIDEISTSEPLQLRQMILR
jgi:hypothetical protein